MSKAERTIIERAIEKIDKLADQIMNDPSSGEFERGTSSGLDLAAQILEEEMEQHEP